MSKMHQKKEAAQLGRTSIYFVTSCRRGVREGNLRFYRKSRRVYLQRFQGTWENWAKYSFRETEKNDPLAHRDMPRTDRKEENHAGKIITEQDLPIGVTRVCHYLGSDPFL